MKQTGESVAFTFSRMQLGDGRASFQVVLYDDGGILLAWLDVPRGPSATIVGLNNIGPQATNQMQSVDLSGITSCSQGQLVQRISGAPPRAPPPPPVQVFTSPRSLDLFDHTVCYNLEEKGAKISGCLMPQLEPFLPVHPAGGLTSNIWLRSSDDWVKIDLEKGRTFPSYRDGAPLDRVYVTGRGTVAFAEPYPGSPGNQTSPLDAHFSLPQVSLLANDNWEGKGGLMVDYKQLAEALVVTVYRGPPFPAELVVPIAQASLSWDGKACVSYPQDLRAVAASLSNKHSLLVGASDGKGIPGRLIWQADMTRLPACKTPQEDTLSSRMPAEIFSAGMMFDLENTMLRFTPLGSSYMGVCRVPGEVDSFPVDLSGDRRLEIPYGGVLKVDFEWEDTNGEQVSYPMLGRDYRSVLIGSDGYVAFDSQVADRIASAERMYRTRRIAPMFATIDLEDSNAKVSVQHYKGKAPSMPPLPVLNGEPCLFVRFCLV